MSSWKPLARLAWRDVRRRPLRTTLIALVVAIPVVVITMVNIGMHAATDESYLDMQFGRTEGRTEVYGDVDVDNRFADADAVVERRRAGLATDATSPDDEMRVVIADAGDVFSPSLTGVYELVDGRVPGDAELTVSGALRRESGIDVGDVVYVGRDRRAFDVVGIHQRRNALGVASIALSSMDTGGTLGLLDQTVAYYTDVETLISAGSDSTPGSFGSGYFLRADQQLDRVPAEVRFGVQMGSAAFLIVLALLISSAFASGARRQLREVGLIAANGADPRQVRRAFALQGAITALAGLALGWTIVIVAVVAGRDLIDRLVGERVSYGVVPVDLLVSALLVVGAGTLAAWWPARVVARTPLLSALAGRRPTRPASPGMPLAGVVLGGIGIALVLTGLGAGTANGNLVIVGIVSLIVAVTVTSSWLVSVTGRLLGRFGGVLRVTGRNLDRQRTHTGPLVASIAAATTLGVLGVVAASTEASNRSIDVYRSAGVWWSGDSDVAAVTEVVDQVTAATSITPPYAYLPYGEVTAAGTYVTTVDATQWRGDADVGDLLRSGVVVVPDGRTGDVIDLRITAYDTGSSSEVTLPATSSDVSEPMVDIRALARLGVVDDWSAGFSSDLIAPSTELDALADDTNRTADLSAALDGDAGGVRVNTYSGGDDRRSFQLAAAGVLSATTLLVLTALAIGLGLARIEQRDDDLLLGALGAAPGFRRRAGAAEAGTITALAMAVAVPLGVALAYAIRTSISSMPVDVPWLALGGLGMGLPLFAAVAFGLTRRNPRRIDLSAT